MKKVKEILKKQKSQLIMLAIIAVLVIFSTVMVKQVILLKNEIKDLKKQQMEVDPIREEIQAISEYAAYD